MSFWVKQPVLVNGTSVKQILPAEDLLLKTTTMISECKTKLDYKVFAEINETTLVTAHNFINENYSSSETRLLYSKDLLQFFLINSLLIFFFPKGQPEKIVGLIVGNAKHLQIQNQEHDLIDVNFLCLVKKLRNLNLAPYLIAVLTKESVERLNISLAYYTISARINSPCFGKKQMYHRLVNIAKLANSGFLKVSSIQAYERVYNNFLDARPLLYINKTKSEDLINKIDSLITSYNEKTYTVFDKASIRYALESPAFHSFAFYKENLLTDFISVFRLDSQNKTGETYKNGYIFKIALSSNSDSHIETIMSSVCKSCFDNNIVDMLTLSDIFPNNIYNKIKFSPGTGLLNYYMFNMDMISIPNDKNGLVTI